MNFQDTGFPETLELPPSASADGRSARWQSHREERRRELIKQARRAVHALGSDASMEDIATAAGTSKSVFYRYFGDKAGLQQAVGEVVLTQMQHRIQEAAQSAVAPREGLLAMVSAYLQMADTSPNVYAFVTSYAPGDPSNPPHPAASGGPLGHFFDAIADMIATPMRSHLGDVKETVIGYWPKAAIGLVRNAGEQWLSTPDSPAKPTQETMARQITAWLCVGIAPELTPAPSTTKLSAKEGL
ncbi:TetR/AcrR family transcriptional regulator [Pseudarthrobacter sp. BRE9]|uniref:TetR/AcrR family transcriptional regulator n=1 Tax=Pseudarthrobacter sp. BRE9 TaxID=2962582 RepID=UPI002881D61F|nr:TetR/AcrR family transcriptional regulator [Pseudarthrobacter sp. BRE9]MDT0168647.1 TetR/AcrR family transcriptional regulator [Pseudarthrobacter sp. BRE9]